MQLFDILQDGFHTPLTETQIADLFQAGRLNRHTRCKPAKQEAWRTIDELFPLLKYHAPWQFAYQPAEPNREFRFRRAVMVATSLVLAAGAASVLYLSLPGHSPINREVTAIDPIPSSSVPSAVRANPVLPTQPSQNTVSVPAEQPETQTIRLAEAQRITEQARRDQALAEQQHAIHEQMLLQERKAVGIDQHVLLDHWQNVNVGGLSVSVKVHDNDTTSFDAWINGAHYRNVKKEKGITGSRADETLIYSNGRASLYYVWEISGRLDHCLLRVRDS